VSLTEQQRAAAEATERSIAVVAGAGTGKTSVLTERYVHLVTKRGVPIHRVLALTFTEKAAREMKERIRKELPAELQRHAEFAPVSTIHAFLARILRERALDAGIDPRFQIADEITAQLFLEDALDDTIEEIRSLDELIEVSDAKTYLLELYHAARATPLRLDRLRLTAADPAVLRNAAQRFFNAIRNETGTGKTIARLDGLRAIEARVVALDPGVAEEFLELLKGNVSASVRDAFRAARDELRSDWEAMPNAELAREAGAAVVEAVVSLDERYTARKRAEGLVDFADLEHLGLALLEKVDVAADYDHLLVDEYQDTSRIQEAILDRLAEGCQRFGVGDAKQSIYRFRYADAAVFSDLQGNAKRYELSGSFRSRPELVDFVNQLFRRLFAGGEVEPQDLEAKAEWRDKDAACVELLEVAHDNEAQAHRLEAKALAGRIRALVEDDDITITDQRADERSLQYRDCAILLRAMTHLPVYERALTEAGVPYVVVMGRGYYAAREVVELAYLLSLLVDPYDKFRAAVVMTSLFCGVPEADLLHLDAPGPLPLMALRQERPDAIPEDRWARLVRFAEWFERWRDRAGRVDTGDLIEDILATTRFADLQLLEPDGRGRYANLMKALRRARQAHTDPATYARELIEFRERERRESEAPIAAEDDNVVKIMTVHAAKGLEFPCVAVADLAASRQGKGEPTLRPDGVFTLSLRERRPVPGRKALRDWDKEHEAAEKDRLLYVALTRAREHLLLTAARYGKQRSEFVEAVTGLAHPAVERIDPAPYLAPEALRRQLSAVRAAVRREDALPAAYERDEEGARRVIDRIESMPQAEPESTPYVAAVADLVEFRRCPRRYRLGRMLGIELDEREGREPANAEEHPRRELGTAFHAVMADIGPGAIPGGGKIREHYPVANAADVKRIVKWATWFAGTSLAQRLRDAAWEAEVPFLARVNGLPMRGIVDLYAPDLPLLLDYKTSTKVREGEYAVQVAIYLEALAGLGRPVPDVAHLVYVDAEQVIEVPTTSLARLVQDYRAAHRGRGRFKPKVSEACTYCDYVKACRANGVKCPTTPTLF
jgi:ATP-dependent helicase/nuclease subunit A